MESPSPQKRARSLRNILIDPHLQLRLCGVMVVTLFIFSAAMSATIYYVLNDVSLMLVSVSRASAEARETIEMAYSFLLKALLFVIALCFVASTAVMLFVSHRIAGASFAITRHIRAQLINGIYGSHVILRKNDYLGAIADAVNELSDKLKKK